MDDGYPGSLGDTVYNAHLEIERKKRDEKVKGIIKRKSCKDCFYNYFEVWGKCQFTCGESQSGFVAVMDADSKIICPNCNKKDELCGEVWLDKPKIFEIIHPDARYKYACTGCEYLW